MSAQDYYNSGHTGGNYQNPGNQSWTPPSSTATPGPPSMDNRPHNYGSPAPPTSGYNRPVYPPQSWEGMSPGFPPQSRPPQYNNEYSSGPPPYNQHYQDAQQPQPPHQTDGTYQHPPTQPPHPQGQDDERGILGMVSGGAAGAFVGHKANHGILGTIGGAITGSIAEDAIKKQKKKKEEEEEKLKQQRWGPPPGQPPFAPPFPGNGGGVHHQPSPPPAQPTLRGNFSASSVEIHLERDYELTARCRSVSGELRGSSIPLNSVLSNHFGSFTWAHGGNFGPSARNVHLAEGGRILDAELADGSGNWKRAWIRLDERISNQNGRLVFLD